MTEHKANTGSFQHRSDTTERERLESLLRIALQQYEKETPQNQAVHRIYMKRDLERLEAMR